ncbi:ATP-dependent RNA helicase [Trachipleistophora hominis]|uniref:RNA helicase n=1 Tax=Trachipleistophora hominis TaxID=72359 RepID=L7JVR4_TRAHO|nr:ATP-dependent RNA helicase [Trachipleistophora hominis]
MTDAFSDKKKNNDKNDVYVFKNTRKEETNGGVVNGCRVKKEYGGRDRCSRDDCFSSRDDNDSTARDDRCNGALNTTYRSTGTYRTASDHSNAYGSSTTARQSLTGQKKYSNEINAHKQTINKRETAPEMSRDGTAGTAERKTFFWRTERVARDGRGWYGTNALSGTRNARSTDGRGEYNDYKQGKSYTAQQGSERRMERGGWRVSNEGLNGKCSFSGKGGVDHNYGPYMKGGAYSRSGTWRGENRRVDEGRRVYESKGDGRRVDEGRRVEESRSDGRRIDESKGDDQRVDEGRRVEESGRVEESRSDGKGDDQRVDDDQRSNNTRWSNDDQRSSNTTRSNNNDRINNDRIKNNKIDDREGNDSKSYDYSRTAPLNKQNGATTGNAYVPKTGAFRGGRYGHDESDGYNRKGTHSYRTYTSTAAKGRSKQFVFPSTYKTTEQYVITSSHPFMRINGNGKIKYNTLQRYAMHYIEEGKHMILRAPTGTGKTLTYLLPIVSNIEKVFVSQRVIKMLVIVPTRELAAQIVSEVNKISTLSVRMVIGGGEYGMDGNVVVATPGRLIDTLNRYYRYNHGDAHGVHPLLAQLSAIVLDEGDTMFDLGFKQDIAAVLSQAHRDVQLVIASATYNRGIMECIREWRCDWVYLCFEMDGMVEQRVLMVGDKFKELVRVIREYCARDDCRDRGRIEEGVDRRDRIRLDGRNTGEVLKKEQAGNNDGTTTDGKGSTEQGACRKEQANKILVFVKRKRTVDALANSLPFVLTSLHGNMPQHQRAANLAQFHAGVNILVATSIAARGLHIQNVNLVINYDLPDNIDEYVHRIGRTGRGKKGTSISFWNGDLLGTHLATYLESCGCEVPGFLKGERTVENVDLQSRFEMMKFADEKSGDSEEGWDDFAGG